MKIRLISQVNHPPRKKLFTQILQTVLRDVEF